MEKKMSLSGPTYCITHSHYGLLQTSGQCISTYHNNISLQLSEHHFHIVIYLSWKNIACTIGHGLLKWQSDGEWTEDCWVLQIQVIDGNAFDSVALFFNAWHLMIVPYLNYDRSETIHFRFTWYCSWGPAAWGPILVRVHKATSCHGYEESQF